MQLLSSLHIVLTCSFVVLLAYLLSRVFTYLAHSLIHASSTPRRRPDGSSRGKRSAPLNARQRAQQEEDYVGAGVMARLQEEDEEDEEEEEEEERDVYLEDAAARTAAASAHTSQFDMGGGIFDDVRTPTSNFDMGGGIFDAVGDREYDVKQADTKWDNGEGEGLQDGRGDGKYKAREIVYMELEQEIGRGNRKREDADENGSTGASNSSVLGDAQGSSSMQQRLPPTWSDLQRMVNLSSKQSSLPRGSPLPED